jgi:peptidyl-prolyl cis-trans isomerase SurA
MKKIKNLYILYVLIVLVLLIPSHFCAEVTDKIVAIVNGDIITLYELNISIKNLTGLHVGELKLKGEDDFHKVRQAVLNSMINELIAEQHINKLGITVAAKDVEDAIERVKIDNKLTQDDLIYSLKAEGITLQDYKERIKKEIEQARLVNHEVKSKIVVTEAEMKDYYNKHIKDYIEEDTVLLARIFLPVRDPDDNDEIAKVRALGNDIIRKIEEGQNFFDLARKYSKGPAVAEGGKLGWIKMKNLEPILKKKIDKLSPGQHSNLDRTISGFQILKLLEEKIGDIKPFKDLRNVIHSKLFKAKVEEKYAIWLKKLRDESYIKIIS